MATDRSGYLLHVTAGTRHTQVREKLRAGCLVESSQPPVHDGLLPIGLQVGDRLPAGDHAQAVMGTFRQAFQERRQRLGP